MQNAIPGRILDFLRKYPPFTLMDAGHLSDLAGQVVVQYHRPGEVLFRSGDTPGDRIFLVREGAVHLYAIEEGQKLLVDICDEGDLFGLRPLLAEQDYMLEAEVQEESLLYAIRMSDLRDQLADNAALSLYLARSVATSTQRRYELKPGRTWRLSPNVETGAALSLDGLQMLTPNREPVTCRADFSIRQAAQRMSDQRVSSIVVVDERQRPQGIITDKDLRRRVATGMINPSEKVTRIMSAPVFTTAAPITVADAQMQMVRREIHHLVLTEDGTDQRPVTGVLTEHDLLVAQGNQPAVLIRRIRRATSTAALAAIRDRAEVLLRAYLEQEVSMPFISGILTAINDALIRRVIVLSREGLPEKPDVPFCWLALGSEGREEQLLRTDQDNALVFGDVGPSQLETVRSYFLNLADRVNRGLAECGFVFCPADMMARNPQWCLSLPEWKRQFSIWIDTPEPQAVMHSSIFFDFRPVYGDAHLAEALTQHIFTDLDQKEIFLQYLAREALKNPPPLTFFRSFVVEKSGAHKDTFDLKARAMMPLADAARVLILGSRVGQVHNTFRRFEKLADLEPQNGELYRQAGEAYELLMRFRALRGLRAGDSGRYLDPADLSKLERLNLRHCFQPIRQLQNLLMTRYQLAHLL